MNPIDTSRPRPLDQTLLLQRELLTVARRLRFIELSRRLLAVWAVLLLVALLLYGLSFWAPALSSWLPVLLPLSVIVAWCLLTYRFHARPLDFKAAARLIESEHPQLKQLLSTAVEQTTASHAQNFLQRKVVDQALHHPSRARWRNASFSRDAWHRAGVLGCLGLVAAGSLLIALYRPQEARLALASEDVVVSVSPGATEAQQGSSLVISARFDGPVPPDSQLVVTDQQGTSRSLPMDRSLSDPVFARALHELKESFSYRIEYLDTASPSFPVEVFQLPSLAQADAALDYPEYTGWTDREILDTRRLSAVEGTILTYRFSFNKPLKEASLVSSDGEIIRLEPANEIRTAFQTELTLQRSLRFALRSTDLQGRQNPFPEDIRIETVPNSRPELALVAPKGDQRVSPIEEVLLQGRAHDDFGLLDYGIGYAIAPQPPVYRSLRDERDDSSTVAFQDRIALEQEDLQPKDVITWFVWADDHGPEGKPRRSTSDLFFADVRPFDEIFREGQGGGQGQGQGQAQQGEELVEQQRQVAIAIWNLKKRSANDPALADDSRVIRLSQEQILGRLGQLMPRLQEEAAIEAATQAQTFMEQTVEALHEAWRSEATPDFDPAGMAAQGAFQALLRMMPDEFDVSRNRSPGQGGGGGRNRNQAQLDQLDFNTDENRYETATEAQSMVTQEEREQLGILSKLSQLARRQNDLNERLQELQTALAAAQSEEEKEKIRRELKRLEEEQRRMLSQIDEARQQLDRLPSNEANQQARQQLDQARENMRQTADRLQEEQVSQALASGARSKEGLENLKEDFRQQASSQFAEQMRQARREARELAEQQRQISEDMENLDTAGVQRLDNSGERGEIAQRLEAQQEKLKRLLQDLRQVTEDAEDSEARLHRQLYDMLRQGKQEETGADMGVQAELLRQGFVPQAEDLQDRIQRDLDELEEGIEAAAASILGNESSALRFAREELEQLNEQLQNERPGGAEDGPAAAASDTSQSEQSIPSATAQDDEPGSPSPGSESPSSPSPSSGQASTRDPAGQSQGNAGSEGQSASASGQGGPGAGGGERSENSDIEALRQMLREFSASGASGPSGSSPAGPLTGDGFGEWNERLRTIEELIEMPQARERLSQARQEAEAARREFKRHGKEPQWDMVQQSIAEPLAQVSDWVADELRRIENPDTLQPIDRDPVPQRYQEAVRLYYESLGAASSPADDSDL